MSQVRVLLLYNSGQMGASLNTRLNWETEKRPVDYGSSFPSQYLTGSLFPSFQLLSSVLQAPGQATSLLGISQEFSFTYNGRRVAKTNTFSNFIPAPFSSSVYCHHLTCTSKEFDSQHVLRRWRNTSPSLSPCSLLN